MKSDFTKHSQQYLYEQSKASKWLSPSLEVGVLPPGKPFHPKSRACWAEQGLFWAALPATMILADSVCLCPSVGCPRPGWVPRVPTAGTGSVGDTCVVSAHAVHTSTRSHTVLCLWLRMVIISSSLKLTLSSDVWRKLYYIQRVIVWC